MWMKSFIQISKSLHVAETIQTKKSLDVGEILGHEDNSINI